MPDQNDLNKPDLGSSYSTEVLETLRGHIVRLWTGTWGSMAGVVNGMLRWEIPGGNVLRLWRRNGSGTDDLVFDSTSLLADGSVTTAKLANGVLSADAAGRAKVADGFTTTAKLADGSVTTAKLADGSVTLAKLDSTARQLDTARIDVASAATVNLTTSAPNTRHINITGTTTITQFTVAVGVTYFVRFNASLTLTNNANIVTQTGANVTTQAGDTCILRATAANVVEVLSYTPAKNASQQGTAPTFGARAWVNFSGTGTVAIRASGNVSSITDNGTGDYTVNFTTAMPDTEYAQLGSTQRNISINATGVHITCNTHSSTTARSTGSVRVVTSVAGSGAEGGTPIDCEAVYVAIFR